MKKPNEENLNLNSLSGDALLYNVLPKFFMELMHKYFRLEIEGLDHIPRKGGGIITPNHSGYTGMDAMLLSHEIRKNRNRTPRVLTHHLWFLTQTTSIPAKRLGFIEATTKNGLKYLNAGDLIVLFPEGEYGNFKPTSEAYVLQEFRRGFVRMALKTQSPIIPTLVIGAEEAHINLSQLKFSKYLRGLILPLPLNIIPLPSRWKIRFLEPIELPYKPDKADDVDLVHEIASDIQERMQAELNREVLHRDSVFL